LAVIVREAASPHPSRFVNGLHETRHHPDLPDDRYFPFLAKSGLTQRLFGRDGGIWTVLRTEPDGKGAWRPVRRGELASFLSGESLEGQAEKGMARAFARTPLCVRGLSRKDLQKASASLREGEVLADTRDAAASALQPWLDRNVAIVGGEVRVRSLGPLLVPIGDFHGEHILETMAFGSDHPTMRAKRPAGMRLRDGSPYVSYEFRQMLEGLTPDVFEALDARDDTLHHFANSVPGECLGRLARSMIARPETAEAARAEMGAYAVRAETGLVRADEAGRVADLAEAMLPSPTSTDTMTPGLNTVIRRLREHIAEHVRPTIAAVPVPDADAESLSLLAP
jgi:hypothetical protein